MNIQVTVCICFAALLANARTASVPLNDTNGIIQLTVGDAENTLDQLEITTKKDEVEKPINLRFPHTVLFGRVCGGTIISPHGSSRLLTGECQIFFSVGASYDYLLAELEEPLDNVTFAAAKLNENPSLYNNSYIGYASFGAEYHGETMWHERHAMEMRTIFEKECGILQEYSSTDMICAQGFPPRFDSACNGDSDSGLVNKNGVLVGILSWAQNDTIECRKGAIVYFSKVAAAREWIR